MSTNVVVLGAGYAGATVVQELEGRLGDEDVVLTWVSDEDYHFVLHEAHRLIRKPGLRDLLTVPVDDIKGPDTKFVEKEVELVHEEGRRIEFTDGSTMDFDYVVDCLGTKTAFYGNEGVKEHALTLKSLDDAMEISRALMEAASDASEDDPIEAVVGGSGLSGIQAAGEFAAFGDLYDVPVDVTLFDDSERVFPGHSAEFQGALEDELDDAGVTFLDDHLAVDATADEVQFDDADPLEYDVFLWTGGVTGRHDFADDPNVEEKDDRVDVDPTLETGDRHVFAAGDSALMDQSVGDTPPPTAEAAWEAAAVCAENLAREIRGRDHLREWEYRNRGTLVSVGDDAVAHDVDYVPLSTFGGDPARHLKKLVGVRWLRRVGSYDRIAALWPHI